MYLLNINNQEDVEDKIKLDFVIIFAETMNKNIYHMLNNN